MHGRVKVRTTEEEKARKAKERQEKLKIFKLAMQKINAKREAKELDKELLELTGQVLSANPDIYTLWNIRREILETLRENEGENMSNLYDSELSLTEHCLKYNPKSYSAWHQRIFVLTTRTDPDWNKELVLCDKYLKFDERNFHTWDYRRFVVANCDASLNDEFDFTTDKLMDNFSNYSAWHYRSKMLVQLYPDLKGGRPIEDSHHKNELKLVQNAAFTDPDDSSAWFYQRWLLSAVKENTQLVICKFTPNKSSIAFNKTLLHDQVSSRTRVSFNNVPVSCNWVAATGNISDSLWICQFEEKLDQNIDIKIEYEMEDGYTQTVTLKNSDNLIYVGKSDISFQRQYSEPVIEELKKQLLACRQLVDMEPDSKWTLLTTSIFLHCIDAKLHHLESIDNLKELKSIDKLRRGYYDDLISKWNIENMLIDIYNHKDVYNCQFKLNLIDKVTCLANLQYFSHFEIVDFSEQNLTSTILPSLILLQHCKVLNLENNKLTTLRGFPELDLKTLNIKRNNIDFKEIELFKNNHINCTVIFD